MQRCLTITVTMHNHPFGRRKLSEAHAAIQITKNVRALHTLPLLFSPSHPTSLQRWSMRKGLGGWWLPLNDPVYFEKVLISASGFLNANKEASKHHLTTFVCCMHNAADDVVLVISHFLLLIRNMITTG